MTKISDSNNGRKGKYRENASKRPPERYDFAGEKRRKKTPRGVYHDTGAFSEEKKKLGFCSPGRYKKQEKGHTPLKRGRLIQKIKKKVDTSHTHAPTSRHQQVLVVSQPSSTDKAPSTDKSSSCSEVCLRRYFLELAQEISY